MKKTFEIFGSDLRRLGNSAVAVVVIIGLVLVPCLYAWFNILSNWDPYGPASTGNVRVAVANDDDGYEMLGIHVNIGSLVVDGLKGNDQMGWVFVDSREEAMEDVISGDCYASLIIPETFTQDFLSILSTNTDMVHPTIEYYENQKKNAIAPKITNKAKTAVQEQINSTIVEKAADAINTVSSMLRALGVDANQVGTDVAKRIDNARENVENTTNLLINVQNALYSAGGVLSSSAVLVDDAGNVVSNASDTIGAAARTVGSVQRISVGASNGANVIFDQVDKNMKAIIARLSETDLRIDKIEEIKASIASTRQRLEDLRTRYNGAIAELDGAIADIGEMQAMTDALTDPAVLAQFQEKAGVVLGELNSIVSSHQSDYASADALSARVLKLGEDCAAWVDDPAEQERLANEADAIAGELNTLAANRPSTLVSLGAAATNMVTLRDLIRNGNDLVFATQFPILVNAALATISDAEMTIQDDMNTINAAAADITALSGVDLSAPSGDPSALLADSKAKLESVAERYPAINERLNETLNRINEMMALVEKLDDPQTKQDMIDRATQVSSDVYDFAVATNESVTRFVGSATNSTRDTLIDLQNMLGGAQGALGNVSGTLRGYSGTLSQAQNNLGDTINLLRDLDAMLINMGEDWQRFVTSDAYGEFVNILKNNPDGLADFLVTPVALNTVIAYEIHDYGSAMAPYYIMLALFVHSLLAATMIKVPVKTERLADYPALSRYFGRYLLFFFLGQAQALITALGCLYYVGMQSISPGFFILACCLCSLNFSMMNYALVYSLDNIGMAAAVIIMVIQVAGSGGSYPVHVLPPIFQKLYPYMPFHYGMDMIRETIGGFYGTTYRDCATILLGMCIIFTVFGLVMYYPAKGINRLIAESKERSGIM